MLTTLMTNRYADLADAKSSAGREKLNSRRICASNDGAFFVLVNYGGCAWAGFVLAGFLEFRFLTLRTVATQSREKDGGDSSTLGASPMASLRLFLTRNPSKRAAAHRAMAKAALFADTSASTRLKRYNHHIEKARHLETAASGQEARS